MATINDYLNKVRQDRPEYFGYSDYRLYKELQDKDPSMPSWQSVDDAKIKREKELKQTERMENPDFLNSLFDWTDLGINEQSGEWAKAAYNNSITGLAYQLYNGEERFNLDDYESGIVGDVFSAVLSFMMPLDILSMAAGGMVGKGIGGLLGRGIKDSAVKSL